MAPGAPKLIFSSSVEALLAVAGNRISERTRAELESMRIGGRHKMEPAYPAEDWARAVKLIAADLFPLLPTEEQHQELGAAVVKHFAESFMGKAMFAAARVIGPRRSMERMTHNLRTGSNFIETRFTMVNDHTWQLWMNDCSDVPGFYIGLLGVGSEFIDGWVDHIELKSRDGAACLLQLTRTQKS